MSYYTCTWLYLCQNLLWPYFAMNAYCATLHMVWSYYPLPLLQPVLCLQVFNSTIPFFQCLLCIGSIFIPFVGVTVHWIYWPMILIMICLFVMAVSFIDWNEENFCSDDYKSLSYWHKCDFCVLPQSVYYHVVSVTLHMVNGLLWYTYHICWCYWCDAYKHTNNIWCNIN